MVPPDIILACLTLGFFAGWAACRAASDYVGVPRG